MRRMPSSAQRIETRRARPAMEGLESRQLLSGIAARLHAHSPAEIYCTTARSSPITPTGEHVVIHVVGLGNLAGTSVDSSVQLKLVYNGTNAYSKIKGYVTGGNRQVPLASIYNGQLIEADAKESTSGVGGNVIDAVISVISI